MTSPSDLFAIVPCRTPGPTPADAIAVGNLDEVFTYIGQTPAREAAENNLAEAQAHAAKIEQLQAMSRACQVMAFADSISHLSSRMDSLETKRDARRKRDAEAKARADEEETTARIKAALDALDPEDGEECEEPEDYAHASTGDLSPLPPAEDPSGAVLELDTRDTREDQPVYATRSVVDPADLARPPTPTQQPIAISLNTE